MEREYPIIDDQTILKGYKVVEKLKVDSKNSLYKVLTDFDGEGEIHIMKAYPYETQEEIQCFKNELEVVEMLKNNPLFVTYNDQFEQIVDVEVRINSRQVDQFKKNYMFVIMKFYQCYDLEKAAEHSKKGLREDVIISFLFQSLNALKILHNKKIVHHDIKLSNFLIISENPLKFALIDFEFAEKLSNAKTTSSIAGTRTFLAPEILNDKEHDTSVDIWGLGVSAYKLAGGCYPYKIISRDSENIIKNKIESNNLRFLGEYKKKSTDLQDLLSAMLKKDPSQRITAEEALKHKLFMNFNFDEEEEEEDNESKLEPLGFRRN